MDCVQGVLVVRRGEEARFTQWWYLGRSQDGCRNESWEGIKTELEMKSALDRLS